MVDWAGSQAAELRCWPVRGTFPGREQKPVGGRTVKTHLMPELAVLCV